MRRKMRIHCVSRGAMEIDQPSDLEQVSLVLDTTRVVVIPFSGRLSQIDAAIHWFDCLDVEPKQCSRFVFTHRAVGKKRGKRMRVRGNR